MDSVICAKMVKKEFKTLYPTVKFSVTSDIYAQGDAVRIRYTDGPSLLEIEAHVKKYENVVKYITISREMSDTARKNLTEKSINPTCQNIRSAFNNASYL